MKTNMVKFFQKKEVKIGIYVSVTVFIIYMCIKFLRKPKSEHNSESAAREQSHITNWTSEQMEDIKKEIKLGFKRSNMSCIKNMKDNTDLFVGELINKFSTVLEYKYVKDIVSKDKPSTPVENIIKDLLPKFCDGYPGSWTIEQKNLLLKKTIDERNSPDSENLPGYDKIDKCNDIKANIEYGSCVVDLYSKAIPFDIFVKGMVDDKTPSFNRMKDAINEIKNTCSTRFKCPRLLPDGLIDLKEGTMLNESEVVYENSPKDRTIDEDSSPLDQSPENVEQPERLIQRIPAVVKKRTPSDDNISQELRERFSGNRLQ